MKEENIIYQAGNLSCNGFLAVPDRPGRLPGILVAHAWRGQDDFAREKARELAKLGYVALAADVYGGGKCVSDTEAPAMMKPLFLDRALLQERILAALDVLKKHSHVDSTRIGAIGFCFGGLTVIELMRTGVPVQGIVSFHGLLGDSLGESKATPGARAKKIHGSILILHGYEDPLVSPHDIATLQKEFNDAGADWEMNTFGRTAHAFMNPNAQDHTHGLVYNERTAKRAWQDMIEFFNEILR